MKVRLTALSISSIDMKTVIMLRRNRNPATPSTNRIALRIRYQERGTPVISIHLLSGEHDRSDDGDQNQHRGDLEGQQVAREESLTDIAGGSFGEAAEVNI